MDALLGTIRARRDELIERGNHFAEATRDRGVGALGKVRTSTVDWRKTVAARRAALTEDTPWFRFSAVERRVLARVEQVLTVFAARVRAEIKRLRQLELPSRPETAGATAKKRGKKSDGPAPKRLVLPIADYETLSVRDVLGELPRLTDAQCRAVLEHERTHKQRRTLLKALEARAAA
jgi:hypothetical protein